MPTCPNCDERVSAREEFCPACGEELEPPPRPRRSGGGQRSSGKKKSSNTTMIVVIIVLGGLGLLVVCGGIGTALFLPAVQQARQAARRSASKNNLKQIGVATHNFHDAYQHFPPNGKFPPQQAGRHSWQTRILPMMERRDIHSRIQFAQDWNSPVNRDAMATRMEPYLNPAIENDPPAAGGPAISHYAGNQHLWTALKPNQPGLRMRDITDGTSNTIFGGEVGSGFKAWGDPSNLRDPAVGINKGSNSFGGPWSNTGAQFMLTDGSVRFINADINPQVLRSLSTPAGGEIVPMF